jgi:hypothetical protein
MVEAQLRRLSKDEQEPSKFVLGPTPAQQKRIPSATTANENPKPSDAVLDEAKFKSKFSSLPEFQPGWYHCYKTFFVVNDEFLSSKSILV